MELKGERVLPADRSTAWAALTDVEVLKLCIPGCESITAAEANTYDIALTAAIGPVKSRFKGRLAMTDIDAPSGYTLAFDGSGGAAGFARGTARVALLERAPRETLLTYVAEAQVGGKLAQVGSRLIDAAAGAMSEKFFEAFGAQVAARAVPGAVAPTAVPAAAPSLWSLLWSMLRRLFGAK
jgi:carbon monoxide dehydrogenase subunit G